MPEVSDHLHAFYEPLLYDIGAGDSDQCADGVAFYTGKVGTTPSRVLDIGAGTGRLAVPLLVAGHDLVCVDQSAQMLGALRQKVSQLTPDPTARFTLLHCAFRARGNCAKVRIAVAMDDFLLHLTTTEGLSQFFSAMATWLPKGGRFVTDIRPRMSTALEAASCKPLLVKTFGVTPDDQLEQHRRFYCTTYWEEFVAPTRELVTTCRYDVLSEDGTVEKTYYRVLNQRVHTNTEVALAAENHGFQLVAHTARFRADEPPESDIGGVFEFELD